MYNCVVLHTFNVYVYVYNGRGRDETQNETSHLYQGISASRLASFLIVNRVVEKSHTPTTTHTINIGELIRPHFSQLLFSRFEIVNNFAFKMYRMAEGYHISA